MPWEKQFDVDDTLLRAMQAFWARGYEATSVQDLVDATGVNRASLYATYGDKRALFLAAIKKYDAEVRRRLLDQLAETHAAPEAIRAVFDKFIDQTRSTDANWGCFITNTALELAAHDPEIAQLVNRAEAEIEAFFRAMIIKGQANGDFDREGDVTMLARQILASLLGLLVLIRSRPERQYLNAVRDGALMILA